MDTTTDHFTPLALRVRGNQLDVKNKLHCLHMFFNLPEVTAFITFSITIALISGLVQYDTDKITFNLK